MRNMRFQLVGCCISVSQLLLWMLPEDVARLVLTFDLVEWKAVNAVTEMLLAGFCTLQHESMRCGRGLRVVMTKWVN